MARYVALIVKLRETIKMNQLVIVTQHEYPDLIKSYLFIGGLQLEDINKIKIIYPGNENYTVKGKDKATPMIKYLNDFLNNEKSDIDKVFFYDDDGYHTYQFKEFLNPKSDRCKDKTLAEILKDKISTPKVGYYEDPSHFIEILKIYGKLVTDKKSLYHLGF